MKTTRLLTLIIAAFCIQFSEPIRAQTDLRDQLIVPLSDPAKPGSLKVGLLNGTIHVTGYSGNQVVIDASVKNADKPERARDEAANGMKRITKNGGLELTATEEKNAVKISTKMINTTMTLNIKVPHKFALNVSTVNDGDIIIENVTGELEIQNVNGNITLTNIAGSAVANTINGLLKATFKSINTSSPMAFSTLNGNVDVTIPASAKFDVKLKSDRGEIYSDFDIDVDKSAPQASRSGKDGMYKVSIDDWVKGKVNGGGSEIMMKNMNGNIYVRKAK